MQFHSQQLIPFFHSVLSTQPMEDGVIPYRFNQNFREFITDFQTYAAAAGGIRIEFDTDAEQVALICATMQVCDRTIKPVYDIYINGVIRNHVIAKKCGTQRISFDLPRPSRVSIWLPVNAEIWLDTLKLKNASYCRAVTYTKKCLFLGDSITQGFHCEYPSMSVASTIARTLDLELLNQGIGGWSHRRGFVQPQDFAPDLVITALGTNDIFYPAEQQDVEGYFEELSALYPDVPTVVITPYRRYDAHDAAAIEEMNRRIKVCAAKKPNAHLIDGTRISPDPSFYLDGLHPNALGMQYVAAQLLNELKNISF